MYKRQLHDHRIDRLPVAHLLRRQRHRVALGDVYKRQDQKWGLASNYDLCINSAMAGIDGTVDVIARFLESRQASQ